MRVYGFVRIEETGHTFEVLVDEAEFLGVGSGGDMLHLRGDSPPTETDLRGFRVMHEPRVHDDLKRITSQHMMDLLLPNEERD